MLHLVRWSQLH